MSETRKQGKPKTKLQPGQIVKRIGTVLLIVIAFVLAYVFLLMGEPADGMQSSTQGTGSKITVPMGALEIPGDADLQSVADTFGAPILSITGGAQLHKARIFDTAFRGAYVRRVTLTYVLDDGTQITAESFSIPEAIALIHQNDFILDADTLYSLGGLNAAEMENADSCVVFGESREATYAVIVPRDHGEQLSQILRYTLLVSPSGKE